MTHVDISPSPRILRMLGEIPFQPWQCIAELIDNSIDALNKTSSSGIDACEKRIVVSWSKDNISSDCRTFEVVDNGPGMKLDAIQNCVRAGFTGNDPANNLGLFGMGFNISTARLGDKTQFLSTTAGSPVWEGVEIDFNELNRQGHFSAPVVQIPKNNPVETGTRITVSSLRPDMYQALRRSSIDIQKKLESVYAPLLRNNDINIMINSRKLKCKEYCTWADCRYVVYMNQDVPAIFRFNENLGEALFNINWNRYLSPDEEDDALGFERIDGILPSEVIRRNKTICGWVGIQRYSHPQEFGIDFIRNGRKILLQDKSMFTYINEIVGTQELEYPVELGSTVGGRIVGEIHIDHVHPTYQKNDFVRTDLNWIEIVEFLRGLGPILPQKRKALGYLDSNTSPLGLLINAYRRPEAGTRNLAIPIQEGREWAKFFDEGNPAYLTDEMWWRAAQEADRNKADNNYRKKGNVNPGTESTDNIDAYSPDNYKKRQEASVTPSNPQSQTGEVKRVSPTPVITDDSADTLKVKAIKSEIYSKDYSIKNSPPLKVYVYEMNIGENISKNGGSVPTTFFNDGNECFFFYDPRHPYLMHYPTSFRDMLLLYLADRFKLREPRLNDIGIIYSNLMEGSFTEHKIDQIALHERATAIFDRLRGRMSELLTMREQEVIDFIYQASGDVEEIMQSLMSNSELLLKFQSRNIGAINALAVAPAKTLIRIVDFFPEELFDGKCFRGLFSSLELVDPNATIRLRDLSKRRIISYLEDAQWLLQDLFGTQHKQRKNELIRCAQSLDLLDEEMTS